MLRRATPPLWFTALVAAALALALRELALVTSTTVTDSQIYEPPALAFWGFIIPIAQAIWTGVQVAAKVSLTVLSWSVKALWFFATKVWEGAKAIGGAVAKLAGKTWTLLRHTYDKVLKPAWAKLWKFVESAKKFLQKYVGPVLKFLETVRKKLLGFYDKWIRPILDTIGLARRVLDILGRLGVDWARKLDEKLARVEGAIDGVFRQVLGHLNQIITVVNRVVTANGLFQRLALIRSIERDIRYVSRAFANWRSAPLTADDWEQIRKRASDRTEAEVKRDFIEAVQSGSGRHGPVISELAAQWRIRLNE